jgi:hypothetical protein
MQSTTSALLLLVTGTSASSSCAQYRKVSNGQCADSVRDRRSNSE